MKIGDTILARVKSDVITDIKNTIISSTVSFGSEYSIEEVEIIDIKGDSIKVRVPNGTISSCSGYGLSYAQTDKQMWISKSDVC